MCVHSCVFLAIWKILSLVHSFILCCIIDFIGVKRKEVKKETGLGITNCKDDNFGEWYSEVCLNVSIVHYSFG